VEIDLLYQAILFLILSLFFVFYGSEVAFNLSK